MALLHCEEGLASGHLRRLLKSERAVHAVGHHEHIGRPAADLRPQHRLGVGLHEQDAVHVEVEGQDGVLLRGDGHVKGVRRLRRPDRHLLALLFRHGSVILEIVEEQEAAFPVRAHGKAQGEQILGADLGCALRQHRFHRGNPVPEEAGEEMNGLQTAVRFPDLAEFAQRCLIVIAELGHLGFVQVRSMLADRIGAALEHVVPQPVAPGAQLDIGQRVHTLVGIHEAVIVAAHHAAAHLAAGVGARGGLIGGLEIISAADTVPVVILINVFLRGGMLPFVGVENPGPVGIAAPQGHHPGRISRAAPGRAGKERGNQAAFQRDVPQGQDVLFTLVAHEHPLVGYAGGHFPSGGGVHVFVVQLHADDRAAVLEVQPPGLLADFRVQAADIPQKVGMHRAHLEGLAVQPVGQSAVAHLAMVEGPHPENHIQAVLPAQFNKPAQIPPPGEVKHALLFLNVVPEHIGGYDVHTTHAHLDDLVLPAGGVHPAVMEFAGHGKEGLPVFFHMIVVEGNRVSLRGDARKVLTQGIDGRRPVSIQIDFVAHGVHPILYWIILY